MVVLNRWLVRIVGFLLIVITSYALQNWSLVGLPRYWLFVAVLLSLVLTFLLRYTDSLVQRCSRWPFLLIAVSLVALLRLVWIIGVPTLPISDFESYNRSASAIAQGVFEFPKIHRGGYPLLLGFVYRVFGTNLLTAKLFNVFLSIVAALLLFWIAQCLLGESSARAATALFALWPAQIMMSSVLATELPYTVLFLSAIAVLLRASRSESLSVLALFSSGVLLGLSNPIRPVSVLVLGVVIVWTLLVSRDRWTKRIFGVALLVMGFSFIMAGYLYVRGPVGGSSFFAMILPSDNLLNGTNIQAKGMWNAADAATYGQLLVERGPEETQSIIWQMAMERIRSNPKGFAALLFEKLSVVWGDDLYGAYWSTVRVDTSAVGNLVQVHQTELYAISQFFYIWVLVLSVAGCYRLQQLQIHQGIGLLLLVLLTFVGVHGLVEVQSRFHYPWEPIFLILGAYGLVESRIERTQNLVVTTAMHGCQRYPGVLIAHTPTEFVQKLDKALKLGNDSLYLSLMDRVARENTWDARASAILQTIASTEEHKVWKG